MRPAVDVLRAVAVRISEVVTSIKRDRQPEPNLLDAWAATIEAAIDDAQAMPASWFAVVAHSEVKALATQTANFTAEESRRKSARFNQATDRVSSSIARSAP